MEASQPIHNVTPLQIVAFLDGLPGHEKQSKGIIQALTTLTQTTVRYIHLPAQDFHSVLFNWLRYVVSRTTSLAGKHQVPASESRVDLIIGVGAHTHIAMALFKQRYGGKVVTCMPPSLFYLKEIDLYCIAMHDRVRTSGKVFRTIGPPNTALFLNKHDKKKGLILVGGIDEKSHIWSSQDLVSKIAAILKSRSDIQWTIASSRRTPKEMEVLISDLVRLHPNVKFLRPLDTPAGWIEERYAECFNVWVTADSISMVYEALTAGCRVGILPVQWKKRGSKYEKGINYVLSEGWAVSYDQRQEGKMPTLRGSLDEASRCAEEILRRWWPDRLQ